MCVSDALCVNFVPAYRDAADMTGQSDVDSDILKGDAGDVERNGLDGTKGPETHASEVKT